MTFILLFFVVSVLMGGILTLIWRKKLKEKYPQIFGFSFVAPFVVGVCLVSISFVVGNFLNMLNSDYKLEESEVLTNCNNGGKIYSSTYWTGSWEYKNSFVYYQKDDKIIDFGDNLGKTLIEKKSQ